MNRLQAIAASLALAFAIGCDGGGDYDDEAPPSPDTKAEPAVFPADHDKHAGGTHPISGPGSAPPDTEGMYYICGAPGTQTSCWARYVEYGLRRNFTNYSSTWYTLDSVQFVFCFQQLSWYPANQWIASGSIHACINGVCRDIGNRAQTSGSCRYVTLGYGDLPLSIPPGGTRHVDLYVQLRDGWTGANATVVNMDIRNMRVWD